MQQGSLPTFSLARGGAGGASASSVSGAAAVPVEQKPLRVLLLDMDGCWLYYVDLFVDLRQTHPGSAERMARVSEFFQNPLLFSAIKNLDLQKFIREGAIDLSFCIRPIDLASYQEGVFPQCSDLTSIDQHTWKFLVFLDAETLVSAGGDYRTLVRMVVPFNAHLWKEYVSTASNYESTHLILGSARQSRESELANVQKKYQGRPFYSPIGLHILEILGDYLGQLTKGHFKKILSTMADFLHKDVIRPGEQASAVLADLSGYLMGAHRTNAEVIAYYTQLAPPRVPDKIWSDPSKFSLLYVYLHLYMTRARESVYPPRCYFELTDDRWFGDDRADQIAPDILALLLVKLSVVLPKSASLGLRWYDADQNMIIGTIPEGSAVPDLPHAMKLLQSPRPPSPPGLNQRLAPLNTYNVWVGPFFALYPRRVAESLPLSEGALSSHATTNELYVFLPPDFGRS